MAITAFSLILLCHENEVRSSVFLVLLCTAAVRWKMLPLPSYEVVTSALMMHS